MTARSPRVGVCIIGFGITGQTHAHAILHHVPSLEIVAICEKDGARAARSVKSIWEKHGGGRTPPRVITDVRDVFAEVVSRRLGNGDLGEVFPGLQHRPIGFA